MHLIANFLCTLFAVSSALAQATPGTGTGLTNPVTCSDFTCIANAIIGFLIQIAYSIVAIMALWGGILFLTSGGNEKRAEAGKKTLWYAVIGFAIVLISQGVTSIIQSFFSSS